MKNIIFLLILFCSLPAFGALESRELKCSRAGTDLLLVNASVGGQRLLNIYCAH